MEDKVKTFAKIADELGFTPRTFKNHINRDEELCAKIKRGLQCMKAQKMLYDKFGYPPGVNKSDYDNV